MKNNHNGQQPNRIKYQVPKKIRIDSPEKPSNPQLAKPLDDYENKVDPKKPITSYQGRIPIYENKHVQYIQKRSTIEQVHKQNK